MQRSAVVRCADFLLLFFLEMASNFNTKFIVTWWSDSGEIQAWSRQPTGLIVPEMTHNMLSGTLSNRPMKQPNAEKWQKIKHLIICKKFDTEILNHFLENIWTVTHCTLQRMKTATFSDIVWYYKPCAPAYTLISSNRLM